MLSKQGVSSDFALNLALVELNSWINSALFLATGKKAIDPAAHTHIATKNTAALQALMAKQAAKKDDNDD